VVLLFVVVLVAAAWESLWPGVDVKAVAVVVKSAAGGTAQGGVSSQAAGWVEPDPFPVRVSALTDGVVEEVLVLEGSPVKKGQVVARLVPDDARFALQRAEADLSLRRAEVADAEAVAVAARTDWEHAVERKRALASAEAEATRAEAALARTRADIEAQEARVRELEDQARRDKEASEKNGAVSERQVVQSRLRADTGRALLRSIKAQEAVRAAEVKAAAAELEAATQNFRLRIEETRALASAEADLGRANAAATRAEAALGEARLRVERLEVVAPMDGIVMRRLVEPGDKLMFQMDSEHSAHAVHIYDPAKLQVRVDVPLSDAAGVGVGQKAKIVVEVLPDRTFDGEITRVVHEADIQKNTLQVKVAIRDPDAALKPEMLARVQFLGAVGPVATRVAERVFAPERLLVKGGDATATCWVVESGRAARRTVRLGSGREEGWVEIVEGLQPGDRVLEAGSTPLSEGMRVRVTGEATGEVR
jgi:RND family efflux transporter MFP subunit